MYYQTVRPIEVGPTPRSEAVRVLREAMVLLARTSRTVAGYHALREAAMVMFHNEAAARGDADTIETRARIASEVEHLLREYEAIGGCAP